MSQSLPPFAELVPNCILDALDSIGLESDGRLQTLNSFENRVYQVGRENAPPLIIKFYRPERWTGIAIIEEHAFVQTLADYDIPVVPALAAPSGETLHTFGGFQFSVFSKKSGRAPQFDQLTDLEWMGRFIGRIHAVGALQSYQHRPALTITTFGEEPLAYLTNGQWLPFELADAYRSVAEQALMGIRRCYERAGLLKTLRLHGDCHIGNILWTEEGPYFVDFDDSRIGPAIQDLWMLLSGTSTEMAQQLQEVLAGYERFYTFNPMELHILEALRTLRLLHYSAWIARRWHDPAFPIAFPWFNTQRYWQERILELREQSALMDEAPLLYNAF